MEDLAEDIPPSEQAEQQEAEVEDPPVDQQQEAPEGDRDAEEKDALEPENAEDRDDNDKGRDRRRSRSRERRRSRSADRSRKNRSRSRDRKSSHRSSRRSKRDSRSPPLGRLKDNSRSRSRERRRRSRSRSNSRDRRRDSGRDRRRSRSRSRSRSPRRVRKSQFDTLPTPAALPPPPALPAGLNLEALKQLQSTNPALAHLSALIPGLADQTPAPTVVRLTNMATAEEISDPEWYEEIKVDIEEESKKYGNVKSIVIPRNGEQPEKSESYGVGLVFVEFEKTEEADAAITKMHGRTFDGRTVIAELFPTDAFEAKTWDAEAASKPTVPGVTPGAVPGMPGIPNITALMQSGLSGLAGGGMGGMLGMGAMGAMGGAKLGFAAGGPGNQDVRPGDWACPMCNNNCFARTMMCNRCKTPRPAVPGGMAAAMPMSGGVMCGFNMDVRPGDWTCPNANCRANVFASKLNCFKCGSERPGGMAAMAASGGAPMGMERRPGDWTCPTCNANVFASKGACFKCGTAKPPGM